MDDTHVPAAEPLYKTVMRNTFTHDWNVAYPRQEFYKIEQDKTMGIRKEIDPTTAPV
jgi:hypothetical protein